MHEVLNLRHGAITRTSILFSEDGVVKIGTCSQPSTIISLILRSGNFDQALWREIHSDTASDIKALQTVVQSLRLVWSENAHVFLRDMCEKSARALLKVCKCAHNRIQTNTRDSPTSLLSLLGPVPWSLMYSLLPLLPTCPGDSVALS